MPVPVRSRAGMPSPVSETKAGRVLSPTMKLSAMPSPLTSSSGGEPGQLKVWQRQCPPLRIALHHGVARVPAVPSPQTQRRWSGMGLPPLSRQMSLRRLLTSPPLLQLATSISA